MTNPFLENYRKIIFYEGMEFNSRQKWWPDKGIRPTQHEGVDICYVQSSAGSVDQLPLATQLPVVEYGEVVAICDDFLGKTVFVNIQEDSVSRLVTAYAHIVPKEDIVIGRNVGVGEIIGQMADTRDRKNRMPSHLHLTFMNVSDEIDPDRYNWDLLCKRDDAILLDPMAFLALEEREQLGENPIKAQWKRARSNT